MATIPSGQKFHTVSADVDTVDRGSAQTKSDRAIYTMQDIADSAGSLPTFTTDLETEVQVGTVNAGGVKKDLFYQRSQLDLSGFTGITGMITKPGDILKTNIIIYEDNGGSYNQVSRFSEDNNCYAKITPDAKGSTSFKIDNNDVNVIGSYRVIFELWYTK